MSPPRPYVVDVDWVPVRPPPRTAYDIARARARAADRRQRDDRMTLPPAPPKPEAPR